MDNSTRSVSHVLQSEVSLEYSEYTLICSIHGVMESEPATEWQQIPLITS